jgi:hypothetical protein
LIAAPNAVIRDVSGQSVIYSQAVAQRWGINSTDLDWRFPTAFRSRS